VSWSRKLDEPIPLPDGRTLVSLHDAANFITALSKEEVALPEWQAAIEALMLVVEQKRPYDVRPDWHQKLPCLTYGVQSSSLNRNIAANHSRAKLSARSPSFRSVDRACGFFLKSL
jgi:hypothetical protein